MSANLIRRIPSRKDRDLLNGALFFTCLAAFGAFLAASSLDGLIIGVCLLLALLFLVNGQTVVPALILAFPLTSAFAGIEIFNFPPSKDMVERIDRLPFLLPLLVLIAPGFMLRRAASVRAPRTDVLIVPSLLLFLYGAISLSWRPTRKPRPCSFLSCSPTSASMP